MSDSIEVRGALIYVGETKQVSDKFQLREFAVETEGQYPQKIGMQFTQDNCDKLDDFAEGMEVVVECNLRGREWTSPKGEVKYFNTLNAWRISNSEPEKSAKKSDKVSMPASGPLPGEDDKEDDLPF